MKAIGPDARPPIHNGAQAEQLMRWIARRSLCSSLDAESVDVNEVTRGPYALGRRCSEGDPEKSSHLTENMFLICL